MTRRVGANAALLAPVLAALAVVAVLAGPGADVRPAAAQAQNRAAVIVHTGGGSAAVCVRFDEPTISGLDALQRAGLGAVIRGFSGQGGAVCGINGVGCSADDACLTCQAPSYWAYHRAGPGAGGFSYSSAGAGSTQVSDGSVEGWQWGTGAPPPFQTVDQVCGSAPPPAAPSPPPAPSAPAGANPGGGSTGGGDSAPTGATADAAAPTTAVVTTTTTAVATTSTTSTTGGGDDAGAAGTDRREVDGELAATSAPTEDDDGSTLAVVLFVLVVAGVGVAAVVIRRRRAV